MSTEAYDLQCKQSDAKELITLLQDTYKTVLQFVFHRIRHRDLTAYKMQFAKKLIPGQKLHCPDQRSHHGGHVLCLE